MRVEACGAWVLLLGHRISGILVCWIKFSPLLASPHCVLVLGCLSYLISYRRQLGAAQILESLGPSALVGGHSFPRTLTSLR